MEDNTHIRMTKQRRVILEELQRLQAGCEHPTADELYELVRRRLPHISLGTVYRNLELLSRFGMIQTLKLGGTRMRFDGDSRCHHHIRCIRCGRIDDLEMEPEVAECDREILEATGYEVVERRFEYLGLCPACREKEHGSRSG